MKREEEINKIIKDEKLDTNLISDGYHTFGELYEHRIVLFIALSNLLYRQGKYCWKSKKHADGSEWEGWFIAGIDENKGHQISYHLPIKYWDSLRTFALDKAPEWDGHTPSDVIKRVEAM